MYYDHHVWWIFLLWFKVPGSWLCTHVAIDLVAYLRALMIVILMITKNTLQSFCGISIIDYLNTSRFGKVIRNVGKTRVWGALDVTFDVIPLNYQRVLKALWCFVSWKDPLSLYKYMIWSILLYIITRFDYHLTLLQLSHTYPSESR